jgi:DNA-binding transcriptional MerR regulator
MNYSVKELAELAGVSVRTLHHYDEIGLLNPSERTESNYRLYTEKELLRLQQILFFKELEFSLEDIKQIIDDPNFNTVDQLKKHKELLIEKANNYKVLLKTIDKTILKLTKNKQLTDKDLYQGFQPEKAKEYRAEAIERWGDKVIESENKLKKLTKPQLDAIKLEAQTITQNIANLMHLPAESEEVQNEIQKHYNHLKNFYEPNLEIYRGLSNLYIEDERFKEFYEKVKPGLAEFISKAMQIFCDNNSK